MPLGGQAAPLWKSRWVFECPCGEAVDTQERRAPLRFDLQRRVIQLLHVLPAFRVHDHRKLQISRSAQGDPKQVSLCRDA